MGDDVSVALHGSDTRQRRAITNFIQHPNFDKETMANDIAVIRVGILVHENIYGALLKVPILK